MKQVAFEDLKAGMVTVETMVRNTNDPTTDYVEYRTYLGDGRFQCTDGRVESEDSDAWDTYTVVDAR